jgi:hypothetical protein
MNFSDDIIDSQPPPQRQNNDSEYIESEKNFG